MNEIIDSCTGVTSCTTIGVSELLRKAPVIAAVDPTAFGPFLSAPAPNDVLLSPSLLG